MHIKPNPNKIKAMSESRETRKLDEATDLVATMIPSLAAPLVLAAADDAILGKAKT